MMQKLMLSGVATAISFFIGCTLQGQTREEISLVRTFEYPAPKNVIIPILNITANDVEKIPDSVSGSWKQYMMIKSTALNFLPGDSYLNTFYKQGNNTSVRPLIFRLIDKNRAIVIFDAEGDFNFDNNTKDTIGLNSPALVFKSIKLWNNDQMCEITMPLIFDISTAKGEFQNMEIQNYLQYQLHCKIGEDTLLVKIQAHNYKMWCYYGDPEWPADSLSSFQIMEPFKVKDKWYKLTNFDLCNNTVMLERIEGDRIQGFREGQYVDMELLKNLTEANLMTGTEAINWRRTPFFLLHFWGEWCAPCMVELPEVNSLDQHLSSKKKVRMIHYPWIFKDNLVSRTEECINKNALSKLQSYCIANKCLHIQKDGMEYCNVADLLNVHAFPQFILIDADGKILLRTTKSDLDQVIEKLQALGLY